MLEPLAVDPNRSVVPAANSIASARLVFPAPAGPTSAITRVPLVGSPAMRLSFVPFGRRESLLGRRSGAYVKHSPSACFSRKARGVLPRNGDVAARRADGGGGDLHAASSTHSGEGAYAAGSSLRSCLLYTSPSPRDS